MGSDVNWWNRFWNGMFGAGETDGLPEYRFCARNESDVGSHTDSFEAWQASVSHLALAERLASEARH